MKRKILVCLGILLAFIFVSYNTSNISANTIKFDKNNIKVVKGKTKMVKLKRAKKVVKCQGY